MPPTRYRISAALLCHDVRLNTSIEIALDHVPGEQEAIQLLAPLADEVVARAWCEGCPYDLSVVSVEPVAGD